MFGFGKSRESMPALKQETGLDELTETSPEVLAKLREMAKAAAEHMTDAEGVVDDALIEDAAYFVALAAEHRGEPYTLENVNNEETAGLMHRALQARGELKNIDSTIVFDNGDMQVGTTVESEAEAGKMVKEMQDGQ